MITLINFLDKKLKGSSLPWYVADDPDQLPSARLYDGDLQVLLKLMEKMQDEIKDLNLALFDLAKRVQSSNNSAPVHATQLASAINSDYLRASFVQRSGIHRSVESTSNRSAVAAILMPNTDADIETQLSTDWSATVVAPLPVVLRNRFSVLFINRRWEGHGAVHEVSSEAIGQTSAWITQCFSPRLNPDLNSQLLVRRIPDNNSVVAVVD